VLTKTPPGAKDARRADAITLGRVSRSPGRQHGRTAS
jgi:hypothetical protein